MSEILRELIESLYSVVNSLIFRRRVVDYIIGKVLRRLLTVDEFKDREVQYCVLNEPFGHEDMKELVESEKGLEMDSEILGFTEVLNEKVIYIAFSTKMILKYIEGINPVSAWLLIEEIARHEAYHAKQYNYILEKGGLEAIDRLSEYLQNSDYEDNIVEQGAWDFQFENKEQDFSRVFDKFIYPERFAGK